MTEDGGPAFVETSAGRQMTELGYQGIRISGGRRSGNQGAGDQDNRKSGFRETGEQEVKSWFDACCSFAEGRIMLTMGEVWVKFLMMRDIIFL